MKMLAEEVLSALAKGLPGSTSGPERRAVAATAGAIRRRPMRAHAQRQRLRTTRAAARPSEEQGDEQRHADSKKKERKKTDNPREGWEDGTPPPHRDFKERCVVR